MDKSGLMNKQELEKFRDQMPKSDLEIQMDKVHRQLQEILARIDKINATLTNL